MSEALLTRAPGRALPQAAYTDPDVFAADLEHVWSAGWLFAGHSCELARPGDYLAREVGRDRVLVVRGDDGALHAHHDVCAHRGSRLTTADRGCVRALVCPYHQWVYGTDGALRAARLMGPEFPVENYRLAPAAVREIAGLVFVSPAADPPDIAPFAAALEPHLAPHRLDGTRIVARLRYRVGANWKILVENNRECYHCRGSHPEFTLSNFDLGTHGDVRSDPRYDAALADARARWSRRGLPAEEISFPGGAWYRIARLPLREGFVTESLDGRPVAPFLGDLGPDDAGSLRLVGLPDLWAHANADYAVTTRLTPVAPDRTDVEVCFLVRADAADADIDVDALTAVWRATSEQDWELCENTQAGVASRGYRPGPLSPVVEASVEAFLSWYTATLDRAG